MAKVWMEFNEDASGADKTRLMTPEEIREVERELEAKGEKKKLEILSESGQVFGLTIEELKSTGKSDTRTQDEVLLSLDWSF